MAKAIKVPDAACTGAVNPLLDERQNLRKGLSRQASKITILIRLPAPSILPSIFPKGIDSY